MQIATTFITYTAPHQEGLPTHTSPLSALVAHDRPSTVDSRSSKIRDRWYRDAAWSAAGLDDQGKNSSYFGVLKNRSTAAGLPAPYPAGGVRSRSSLVKASATMAPRRHGPLSADHGDHRRVVHSGRRAAIAGVVPAADAKSAAEVRGAAAA